MKPSCSLSLQIVNMVLFFCLSGFAGLYAQPSFLIQDSLYVHLVGELGDTSSPDEFWAAYSFENVYDSANIFFVFSEAQINDQRIELDYWVPWRFTKNLNQFDLSDMSKTRPFTITAGDTITYYREFSWQNPHDSARQTVNNFFSDDTLTYIIRLRKSSDDSQIAVLDSIGVLAEVPSGSPTFYGSGAPMAIREYVVPGSITSSINAYLSIDVVAQGSGDYYTARSDEVVGRLSRSITDSTLSIYFSTFNGLVHKRISEKLEELKTQYPEGTGLRIVPNSSTSGAAIRVMAFSPPTTERRNIMVFSMDGKMVHSYSTVSSDTEIETILTILSQGTYYVVYAVGKEIVSVDMLNVLK